MCGIVGYVGPGDATPVLMEGLKRLEYRGYDSAGITVLNGTGELVTIKRPGKIVELETAMNGSTPHGTCGIAHTRWATHGPPNRVNAHPHLSEDRDIALVHNGIIENASILRYRLEQLGYEFRSETDTEVMVHLIDEAFKTNDTLEDAVAAALLQVEGAYGIAVMSSRDPQKLVAARHGSPLLLGIGENGDFYVASDVAAMLAHTRDVVYLDDGDYAVVGPDSYATFHLRDGAVKRSVHRVTWDLSAIERGGYEHFMLKEIFEQPSSLRDVMRGRLLEEQGTSRLGGITIDDRNLAEVERIVITACGTSWHAGLIGEYMLEELARIPVEVEYASEFRYKNPVIDRNTLVIAISQSGETADTLAALREAKQRGARTMGIVNAVGSSIARETDFGMYLHAGPEIGVASTKAFTSQIVALALFTLYLGRRRSMSILAGRNLVHDLRKLPEQVEEILSLSDEIEELAPHVQGRAQLPLSRTRIPVSGGARGRAQAQRGQLHPRRGVSRGGDEARSHRADRREHAGGGVGSPRCGVPEGGLQHRRGESARGPRDRGGQPGQRGSGEEGGSHDPHSPDAPHAPAHPGDDSAPAPGVPHRHHAWVRRRPASKPGQVRHGRVGPRRR